MADLRSPSQRKHSTVYSLRPLQRMRQLAVDIQGAVERNDMPLVYKAAGLLPQALAQVQAGYAALPPDTDAAMELAVETRILLELCESSVQSRMANVAVEIRRMQRGRHAISKKRAMYAVVSVGRKLNLEK